MNGVLNVYKEPGFTSFDVVAKLRGILKQKKIGHTGTLDPDAEGVLVICLGNATKLCEMLTDKDKEYTATLRLGITTDTEDLSGTVLSRMPVTCTEQMVRDTILSFIGRQEQVPPMYSALKQNGKRLYTLAHAGIVVERAPRPIEIYDIRILEIALPTVRFTVRCSKGTYIRSLCRDIGERLSCGGCMEHLLRNRVSSFTLDTALTLSQIEAYRDADRLSKVILPIDSLFPDYERCVCQALADRYLYNGNALTPESIMPNAISFADGKRYFIYDSKNELKGMYVYQQETNRLVPYKMFLG